MLYDFSQDGLEELYIVEYVNSDNGGSFRHKMYSGKKLLFEEEKQEGLDIYWNKYNYYIVTDSHMTRGYEQLDPNLLGIKTQHDYVISDYYPYWHTIIHPGNLKVAKTNIRQIEGYIWGFETDGQFYEDEQGPVNAYYKNDQTVSEDAYNKFKALYEKAPNHLQLFSYEVNSIAKQFDNSNTEKTLHKLSKLYNKYSGETNLPYTEDEIFQMKEFIYLISTTPNVQDMNDYVTLFRNFEFMYASTMPNDLRESFKAENFENNEGISLSKFKQQEVDDWIYRFFGIRMDHDKFKEQLEKLNAEEGSMTQILEDDYACLCDGLGSPPMQPDVKDVEFLKHDFIAIHYRFFGSDTILRTDDNSIESGVAIVKKVVAENGETFYPFIGKFSSIEEVDEVLLNAYAEQLDIVIDHRPKPPETQKVVHEESVKERAIQENSQNTFLYIIIGLLVMIVLIMGGLIWRQKNKKPNTP